MSVWTDLVTRDQREFTPAEQTSDGPNWLGKLRTATMDVDSLAALVQALYRFLQWGAPYLDPMGQPVAPLLKPDQGIFLPDHLLLTSAIACCLGYQQGLDAGTLTRLRCAALSHALPPESRDALIARLPTTDQTAIRDWWFWFLNSEPPTDKLARVAWVASQATAGGRATITKADLQSRQEDLAGYAIGLVLGGATKIKSYVFESARLPQMRGGSALLDRLNLVDARALFGERWGPISDPDVRAHQQAVWTRFQERLAAAGHASFEAPECVIYANGGDVLALAPPALAPLFADELERLYSAETLTANSVAAAGVFDLLELQYGVRPTGFWGEDYQRQTDAGVKSILAAYHKLEEGAAGFERRKVFGELAAALTLRRYHRREGNASEGRSPRAIPHLPGIPYGQRCSACDRRGAVVHTAGEPDLYLCEPCARKHIVGQRTKKKAEVHTQWFADAFDWRPQGIRSWDRIFEDFLADHSDLAQRYYRDPEQDPPAIIAPTDLSDIGAAAKPDRFIGVIYGDGNNVGALIEHIQTPAQYRQFAQRLFDATQQAVFRALAEHLHPVRNARGDLIHPFEIISIGGDDVFLIVPGHTALEIATAIAQRVENQFPSARVYQELGKEQRQNLAEVHRYRPANQPPPTSQPAISFSAGVVIAAEDTPFYFLREMVEELLKSAKKKAKSLQQSHGYYGGTVDFAVLKSTGMMTTQVAEFREQALQRVRERHAPHPRREVLHLTARPYTLGEMGGLLETARTLKQIEFPTTQLHALRQRLDQGRLAASLDYLYFRSRLKLDEKQAARLAEAFDAAWHRPQDPVPWRQKDRPSKEKRKEADDACPPQPRTPQDNYETVLADVLEIYEFAPDGAEGR